MAKILCFSNHKGGVGKTCCVCNIGAGLSLKKKNVLMIDLDPQANLSLSLGIKNPTQNIYQCLSGQYPLSKVIQSVCKNLDIIPSHLDLSGSEIELSSESGREFILKELLEEIVNDYDYIIIDCAPSLGLLTLNALTASTEAYVPLQAQFLALQGLSKLKEVINKIQKRLNKNLGIGGVIITQFDGRKILNREVAEIVEEYFPGKVFKTCIRDNIALAEATSKGIDIFRYKPKSHGAVDYRSLCEEILKKDLQRKNERSVSYAELNT